MTPTPETPSADKVQAIIDAQVAGGFKGFSNMRYSGSGFLMVDENDDVMVPCLLGVLLHPAGLRAAYGNKLVMPYEGGGDGDIASVQNNFENAAILILRAWLSSGPEAAIRTAFDLLPQKP